jgi:cytochrome c oxidase subunit III
VPAAENITQPGLQPGIPTTDSGPIAPRLAGDSRSESPTIATPLAHHFRDLEQQHEVGTLGMWMFLATEVMFFGGALTAFEIYHYEFPVEWMRSSALLYTSIGAINTLVLLCSSLTMALAVQAARAGQGRRMIQVFLAATMALGLTFLVLKGVEYYLDYREHLIPNLDFRPEIPIEAGRPEPDLNHMQLFFAFYFVLTAIHAAHMIIGLVLMAVVFVQAGRGRYGPEHNTPLDALGLYWHLVDIVWVFLLPLLYLIR